MFFRILKKDLKRKKTMNVILLLFVIICSMFTSASLNNISAVTSGIEHYFSIAGVSKYIVDIGEQDIADDIKAMSTVTDVKEQTLYSILGPKYFSFKGKKLSNFVNPAMVSTEKEMPIKLYDTDNDPVDGVEEGWFYATAPLTLKLDVKEGDVFTLNVGDTVLKLKYKGRIKNAIFGNDEQSSPFLLLDEKDYQKLSREPQVHSYMERLLYVNASDDSQIKALLEKYDDVSYSSRESFKTNYIYDMLVAYIMMAVSIVLMATAFVVLRFTIRFTISEEFREIGVMKAVGIDNSCIRRLYITKYLAISVFGAVIGFLASIPLTNTMLKTVSGNMVLESDSGFILGLLSSAFVVIVIVSFCYLCTRRIKKLSAIDAVRSGQTGERFKKRSLLHLGRSKLPTTGFLALNDVLSAPKQFSIITVIFTLCMLLMTTMSNFSLTLKSESMYPFFSISQADVHIGDISYYSAILDDFGKHKEIIDDMEQNLKENGMDADCSFTFGSKYNTTHGDKKEKIFYIDTKGNIDFVPECDEGSIPRKTDEINLTGEAMKKLGVGIGDKVKVEMGDKIVDFIVTGKFSTFLGSGLAARVHSDFELATNRNLGTMGLQVKFKDAPDQETIDERVEKIKDMTDSDKVFNSEDMIKFATGMSDTLNAMKYMMMILTTILTTMIVVLMERSFISKEKSEIALMKAVGIPDRSIILHHSLRFVIVSILAVILSSIVLMPISNATMKWVCNMIGDISSIKCGYDPIDVFVICPAILIGVAAAGSLLTALYTKTIRSSDTASIE